MAAEDDKAQDPIEIPDGAVEISRIVIVSYALPDGTLGYCFGVSPHDTVTSSILGHLALVQHDVLKRNDGLSS